jgi:MAF protein
VLEVTLRKLAAAAEQNGHEDVLLAADTVVVLDGCMLNKPADAAEARAMLQALRCRVHRVLTAVALAGAERLEAVVGVDVLMRDYSDEEIEASIARGTPFDKAGGYAIQDPDLHPVARCDGCFCAVMGLPLWTVYEFLVRAMPAAGLRPPDATFDRCTACRLRPHAI